MGVAVAAAQSAECFGVRRAGQSDKSGNLPLAPCMLSSLITSHRSPSFAPAPVVVVGGAPYVPAPPFPPAAAALLLGAPSAARPFSFQMRTLPS